MEYSFDAAFQVLVLPAALAVGLVITGLMALLGAIGWILWVPPTIGLIVGIGLFFTLKKGT